MYDTTVVAYANGDLVGRRAGNVLDRRLRRLEEFLSGARVALYNAKLLNEYGQHVARCRNDVIEAFLTRLADHGKKTKRSTLSRQDHGCSKGAGWPSHDQHLLAAALEGTGATILVTEDVLARCAAAVRKQFGITVVKV